MKKRTSLIAFVRDEIMSNQKLDLLFIFCLRMFVIHVISIVLIVTDDADADGTDDVIRITISITILSF